MDGNSSLTTTTGLAVMAAHAGGPAMCEEGGDGGFILPLVSNEYTWPAGLRGFLYGLAMVYCFLGVSIIADIFMDSITAITSRRKRFLSKKDNAIHTGKVWNDTVATLSLMALGSSAPEICLSLIEMLKKDFHVGGLGPSTIVGSAAFNLLIIVAVCVVIIPSTEVRRIAGLPVFYVTAAFSLVAYLWLVVILTISSVDIVEIWEAAVTLALLPVLIWVSWKTDTGDLMKAFNRILGRPNKEEEDNPEGEEKSIIVLQAQNLVVNRSTEDQEIEVIVKRTGDLKGRATCAYRTERFSAVPEYDYSGDEGMLEWEEGVESLAIHLRILASAKGKAMREFFVVLEQAEGVEFDKNGDGGEDAAILPVVVMPSSEGSNGVAAAARAPGLLQRCFNQDALTLAMVDWYRQSIAALYCNGSAEEQRNASISDWVNHLACLPWKIIFLPVPPLSLWGGWSCFYGSLVMIAGLTAVLSDLAEIFGCVIQVHDIITAMTFVSLGTSMPDLFASLSAARVDPTADASIVNVTGSNAVNVYLGLGLPWTVGAIYWTCNGRTADWENRYGSVADRISGAAFVVDSSNLGFSVLVFTFACCEALLLLYVRRKFLGAELGGPFVPKMFTGFTFAAMWAGFCGIVSWRVMRWDLADHMEEILVLCLTGGAEAALGAVAIAVIVYYGKKMKAENTAFAIDCGRAGSIHSRPQLATHRSSSALGGLGAEAPTRALKTCHRAILKTQQSTVEGTDGRSTPRGVTRAVTAGSTPSEMPTVHEDSMPADTHQMSEARGVQAVRNSPGGGPRAGSYNCHVTTV